MEKACRLPNSVHSEIAPALSLPFLHVSFGSADRKSEIGDGLQSLSRPDVLMQASTIAQLLSSCDVSYLNLKDKRREVSSDPGERSWLYHEVLKYNPEAFKCLPRGPVHPNSYIQVPDTKPFQQKNVFNDSFVQRELPQVIVGDNSEKNTAENLGGSSARKKPKIRKRDSDAGPSTSEASDHQDAIKGFCEIADDFCGKAEAPEEEEEGADGPLLLPLAAIKDLINEIMNSRSKKFLNEVPLDCHNRLLAVLDRQIQCAQGLSIDANENVDSDTETLVFSALEATHAALLILTHPDMPKQIYREEMIERIIDTSRHQINICIGAFNPQHRNLNKATENMDGYEDEDDDFDIDGSASKKRRTNRSGGARKSYGSRVSQAVHSLLQKLCLILGFLKDLLPVIRLSDSCVMQLVRTSFSTFLVDNVQLLQLKSIDLACGVFAFYTQHRGFLIDETLQLLRKIQFSKRAIRTYHLPDEEQKQIQMITAILLHLVQFSATVPDSLKSLNVSWSTLVDATVDPSYPIKCLNDATEASCHFWTGVLQRVTGSKTQDLSEAKGILENLVADLLVTLNLPEYPASAPILEVLCVLLLQNAGLKSKDISARCLAIDLLGNIAARLKRDAVILSRNKFWILEELDAKNTNLVNQKGACAVCQGRRGINVSCDTCGKCFHWDCMGIGSHENYLGDDWSCHLCLSKVQLGVLQSYHKLQGSAGSKRKGKAVSGDTVTQFEAVQQILLSYLQEAGQQDDENLFTRWFYLCMWYKDDPQSQEKIIYYLSRLKAKEILQDPGGSLTLSRESARKICLALGQKNSFSRGFDKILMLLLASLRENSPIIRAKALRAVSGIVEADPEVLRDKRVQAAVEGRFCDSAISVREAALELVGRHIASHPDVGLQYIEKVAERIKDMGVSVRKRAIKIIRDLFTSNPDFTGTTHAFIEIISRVNDDESSVQDLVCKTFYELWFEEPSGSDKHYVADGSSVPMEVANKTEQIVDMLRLMPNHQPLITIVKRNLALDFLPQSAKATGVNHAALASIRKRCELICKRLLERILQVNEGIGDEEEVPALPYVLALHAFCVVDPTLCVPATDQSQFVVTLQPYLKNQVDDKAIAKLLESIIFVIDAVLPLIRKPQQSLIVELEQDLKHMIVRHSFLTVVHACIRCLCSLSKTAARGAKQVDFLVHVFYKHLRGPTSDNNQMLGRSLFCLGLLLRYGYELMISCDTCVEISKILGLLKRFLLMEDFSLKVRALQALGNVLIAKPEYMLEKDIMRLLEASLSSDVDTRLKIQSLQNMYEYLLDAESQLSGESANKALQNEYGINGTGVSPVPVAAGAGDTNICGGIIQLYWNCVLERCVDSVDQVRQNSLKIVEIVLRQGLVHPITCVPHLIALETDPLDANSKLAHHLLMNMNEKYPSFFESRLGDGLQMSFRFFETIVSSDNMLSVNSNVKANPLAFVRPGVSRIYRMIRSNRNSRNKFMRSIVRKFESDNRTPSPIKFLVYCTEVLASLPFTIPDEPLYLIYDINRVIQVRAGALESNMKIWSSLAQQRGMVKASSRIGDEEVLNERETNTIDGSTDVTMPEKGFDLSETDMQRLKADCHDAIALQLLLKLKRHLKIVYSLNDARCQAFSLREPPKPGETISKQNIPLNISDVRTELPSRVEDMVQLYQEYKTVLRDDSIDYAIYTASIPKKRQTPRNPRVRKSAVVRDDEEEDEDDDWIRGPRNLDFSSPGSGGGGRVTRSRSHLL
ncbi:Nipped-B-like protein [Rhynchospora pubera]|uniref:Sister chromatid cohesion protein n=1 Tax=Rhynchospora pubera TaxID=906938 RepID=A0AAV8HCN1_9POAL|nr:Nipped-B-like protein [Rhynchospora pubera]